MSAFSIFRVRVGLLSLGMAVSVCTFADWVQVNGQKMDNVSITGISGTSVSLKGRNNPIQNVTRLQFERPSLPQAQTGIVLKDGSRLAGSMLERDKSKIVFYSVIAGRLDIPMSDLAGVFYQTPNGRRTENIEAPALITRGGETLTGRKVLWADHKSAAILTEDGLKRFDAESVSQVWWSKTEPGERIRLRNGDLVNLPVDFKGETIHFQVAGKDVELPISALVSVKFE